jgi:transposase-like protein
MGQDPWNLKQDLIRRLVGGQLTLADVAQRLGRSPRTIQRARTRLLQAGPEGVRDHRTSNSRQVTLAAELAIP